MHHVSRFTFHVSRFTPHASRSQRGVALIVTLLLLSIITFMTVTFLVVSRSQKGSVVTETDQAIARLAADTALERAKAELLAGIMGSTNEFNYGLLVSTNYINSAGFISGNTSPYNASYNYPNGAPLNLNDFLQNVANLLYNPRPPVFFVTNALTRSNEFRFYLDLNRNRLYDPNGLQPEIVRDPLGALGFYDLRTGQFVQYQWPPPANIVSNLFIGDPDWIGSLERPEITHSADNKFVNRYAYIAIPAGNALDVNAIHNYAKWSLARTTPSLTSGDGFLRDQGVGTWEMNLAAFLVDLNTNLWPGPEQITPLHYEYFWTNTSVANNGSAFDDAVAFMRYRYATNWHALASISSLFTNYGRSAFLRDGIDGYSATVMFNASGFSKDPDGNPIDLTAFPWPGGDNPNHFYTTQDLFDNSKTASMLSPGVPSFIDRLKMAGTNNDSYNRNTYYRLLSQLGTDSAPEPPGKLNLNYRNVDDNGNVVPGMATNFISWTPEQFFTNAAIRLLANAGYTAGVGPTNLLFIDNRGVTHLQIQIWPTNFYTPSVHRLLQLAANIYDASTNRVIKNEVMTNLPSVFRPMFNYANRRQVFITGYQEVQDASVFLKQRVLDLTLPGDRNHIGRTGDEMLWGVPLVIGAKKGLPNFNKFTVQTQVQVTRKLQFHRPGTSITEKVNELDQMFVVGITNFYGIQAWNSYATPFPRSLRMVVIPDMFVALTNTDKAGSQITGKSALPVVATNIPANAWAAYNPGAAGAGSASFITLLASGPGIPFTNYTVFSTATYLVNSNTFVPLTGVFERTLNTTNLYIPHWRLNVRNRIRFALVDTSLNRLVDYVNLDGTEEPVDLTDALMHENNGALSYDPNSTTYTPSGSDGSLWCTKRLGGVNINTAPTFGVMNQIQASLGLTSPDWKNAKNDFPAGMNQAEAIAFFKGQFTPGYLRQSNTFNAPYVPFRNVYKVSDWQANDPLVHYTIGDLKNLISTNGYLLGSLDAKYLPINSLLQVNERYEPWGGNPRLSAPVNAPLYELRVKDPVANRQGRSDHWDFPTNKFPNVGWLGRVHRGTPWQTVYLKSPSIDLPTWQKWTGNGLRITNFGQLSTNILALYVPRTYYTGTSNEIGTGLEAYLSMPTNDWHVLDLFTTALNDNATRGQLSINQTNLAAWSAVLSGVVVLTNTAWTNAAGDALIDANRNPIPTPMTVQPAGFYNATTPLISWPPVARIVNAINFRRANTNLALPVFPNRSFQSLGDILAVPELTVASPFLNTNIQPGNVNYALTDAACERIPQQILGLLKCDHTPRFVVYSFGQALKPADRSLVTSGAFSRLCTNYQVMAEAATRAVVRIDGAPTNAHIVIESFNVLPPD